MTDGRLPTELRIVEQTSPAVEEVRHAFNYEDPRNENLGKLRRRYRLRSVVKGAKSEFDRFLLLRDWVKSRWAHGWDEAKATKISDGNALLEDAARGLQFCCGTYATLFVQCLLSLGYQATKVSVSNKDSDFIAPDEGNVGHVVTEVWSNDWRKWVLMDPDVNCHYEHEGTPLSAYEVRGYWVSGRWREVKMVRGTVPFEVSETPPAIWKREGMPRVHREFEKFFKYNAMDYYLHIAVQMWNDDFSSRKGRYMLGWADEITPPRLVSCNSPVRHPYTQNLHDLYWSIDHTHIGVECAGKRPGRTLRVTLESAMPNLDHYTVQMGEGRWRRRPESFVWRLKKGRNTLRAASTNTMGLRGPESFVTVAYAPSRL